jgi:hypothetical protein
MAPSPLLELEITEAAEPEALPALISLFIA